MSEFNYHWFYDKVTRIRSSLYGCGYDINIKDFRGHTIIRIDNIIEGDEDFVKYIVDLHNKSLN